jgi:hypothetical protein
VGLAFNAVSARRKNRRAASASRRVKPLHPPEDGDVVDLDAALDQ